MPASRVSATARVTEPSVRMLASSRKIVVLIKCSLGSCGGRGYSK